MLPDGIVKILNWLTLTSQCNARHSFPFDGDVHLLSLVPHEYHTNNKLDGNKLNMA